MRGETISVMEDRGESGRQLPQDLFISNAHRILSNPKHLSQNVLDIL